MPLTLGHILSLGADTLGQHSNLSPRCGVRRKESTQGHTVTHVHTHAIYTHRNIDTATCCVQADKVTQHPCVRCSHTQACSEHSGVTETSHDPQVGKGKLEVQGGVIPRGHWACPLSWTPPWGTSAPVPPFYRLGPSYLPGASEARPLGAWEGPGFHIVQALTAGAIRSLAGQPPRQLLLLCPSQPWGRRESQVRGAFAASPPAPFPWPGLHSPYSRSLG